MQNSDLVSSFAEIAREKDIDRDTLQLIVEDVFRAMIRKRYGSDDSFEIILNPDHGDMQILHIREVVENWAVEDPVTEIEETDAQQIDEDFEVGHSQFNLKTTTTRPSNSFGGINYAALDKKTGCRAAFIPDNDFLLEIDISAYHPTLAAQLVDYEFEHEDIHQAFADMYGVDYKKAKELTFKQLYGGVFEEYKDLEFFKRVEKYIDDISSKEKHVCKSGYVFKTDMKKQKLFNYILQNTETYYNVLILEKIIKVLKNAKTRIIHYTYDSFLLDVSKDEKDIIESILDIFKEYGFSTKVEAGSNYDALERV